MKKITYALFMGLQFLAANIFAGTTPQSANVIAFGDNKTLFVGDSKSATIYAYVIPVTDNKAAQMGYNLSGIDDKVARFLNTSADKILARGFAINPATKEAYISFDKIQGNIYIPVILIVNQTGNIRLLDLVKTPHTEIKLSDPNTQDFKLWSDVSLRSMTITNLKFFKNKIYVCGLSNAEFSSTLRVFDFPFNDKKSSSSVEMYHAVHSQNETRAPMRNLDFVSAGGKDYLVGSYTCTPFVAVALDELKDGSHVIAKTLAEMAVGNTPIDLFGYTAQDWGGNQFPVMLLTNKNHAAELIKVTDIIAAINKKGINTPIPTNGVDKEGMPSEDIPQLIGIIHAADQDPYHIAALRRNIETGTLDLFSFMKGAWIRMDEFESEFAFPTYKYTPDKKQIREFQGMNLKDIGKPEKFTPKDK
jgi:hypothetical protein